MASRAWRFLEDTPVDCADVEHLSILPVALRHRIGYKPELIDHVDGKMRR